MTPVEALAMGTAMLACWDRLPADPEAGVSVYVNRRVTNFDGRGDYVGSARWFVSGKFQMEDGFGDGPTTALMALASALSNRLAPTVATKIG